ncbi:uncharacterized protein BN667_00445 [Clostridium sp. CAG:465]|nr:uncharacterized protein BN667_00445 [Clostridium sp. CAG:465]
MTRLQLNPEEEITRKEYLKRKKKQKQSLKKKSKISYIMVGALVILAVYVFFQFYVYSKSNNYKYVEGDGVSNQKVYNMYYVTEGYTYDPVYSLNSIRTDGFNDTLIYQNSGMHDIISKNNYIYGIKNGALCRFSKENSETETLVNSGVEKYTLTDTRVYYIANNKLSYIDVNTKENKEFSIDNVSEVLVDNNNLYVAKLEKTKKILVRYDLEGGSELKLTDSQNVSYIIQDENSIYFVNKADENKIYKIGKDGSNSTSLSDAVGISDKGNIKEIDGNKYLFVSNGKLYYINPSDSNSLWSVSLSDNSKEKVIYGSVQILQNVDDTVFYKVKNEMGIYLYNYNTKFMSKVTNRNVSEFSIDGITDSTDEIQTKGLNKN